MRTCIETCKAAITGLEWTFTIDSARAKHLAKRTGDSTHTVTSDLQDKFADKIDELHQWWEKPDRINNWTFSEWLGALLEDQLVLDACALYPHLTLGGDLHSLELLDSSTIKPLLDHRGATPQPPYAAYQQILWGFPRGEYSQSPPEQVDASFISAVYGKLDGVQASTDALIYKVRNRRTRSPYGYCYDAQTEVLTNQGWKFFAELDGTEAVATRSANGEFEWQTPTAYVNQPYDGDMVRFDSQVYDLLVTPNHRMVVKKREQAGRPSTEECIREARWFVEGADSRAKTHVIPGKSHWAGLEPGQFCLEPAERRRGRHHPAAALKIEQDAWVAFLGLYLAEGSTVAGRNTVYIAQASTAKDFGRIQDMLEATGLNWTYQQTRDHCGQFYVNHGPLADWLRDNCYVADEHRSWEKCVPSQAKNWTPRLLNLLFDWMMIGDGHTEKNGFRRYMTTSPHLADDLLEVLQKAGREGWIKRVEAFGIGRRPHYRISDRPGAYHKVPVPTVEHYNGTIHCVSVPNGVVYVRRNGRTAWCGNSNVEQALTDVDLWLKRYDWLRSEYTAGVTPEMIVQVDASMTPEQLRAYESVFNDELSGRTAERHRARFLPAGFNPSFPGEHNNSKFTSDFDLHLIRLICAAFDVLPTSIGFSPNHGSGNMGGQGHSQGEQDAQLQRGLKPTAQWVANLINEVCANYLDKPAEVVFKFQGLDQEDEQREAALLTGYVDNALMTVNEGRDALNLPRYPHQNANEPFLSTPTGPAFLNPDAEPIGLPGNLPSAPQNHDGFQQKPEVPAKPEPVEGDDQTQRAEQKAFLTFAAKRAGSDRWRDFQFKALSVNVGEAANRLAAAGDLDACKALFALSDG
jgi:hypothetical protein